MTKVQTMIASAMHATTPAERLANFLLLDASGLPGATALRDRQARIRTRANVAPVYSYKPVGWQLDYTRNSGLVWDHECGAYRNQAPIAYTVSGKSPAIGQRHELGCGACPQIVFVRSPRAWRDRCNANIDRDFRRAHATGDDKRAVNFAAAYHEQIGSLSTSSRAEVVYARGPQECADWNAYAKSYGRPANWINPSAHVEYRATGTVIVMHTARGKAIEVPMPPKSALTHAAQVHGDLYCIERHAGVVERYSAKGKRTGYAVHYTAGPAAGWEHGKTITEIRAEHARKVQLIADKEKLAAISLRQQRKARLIARICRNLSCTIEDARAVGYCRAGIDGFRQRFGLAETATVAVLRATGNYQVSRVIEHASQRAAVAARS